MRRLAFLASFALGIALANHTLARPADIAAPAVNTYILLDRTGSMQGIWDEALKSVNSYAEDLGKSDKTLKASVTLAVFDAQDGLKFDVLRDHAAPDAWKDVTSAEASPRGMTPLYDAIGRIMAMADHDNPKKAVIVIMTDGEENASREVTSAGVKAALDRARAKGWEVVFLGAQFANFADAQHVGMAASKTMAVDKSGLTATMRRLARKSASYGSATTAAPAPITFDAEDRAAAKEDRVKGQ